MAGVLAELGFGRDRELRSLLIEPPDHVLAEAGAMKPRPAISSSLKTAKPAKLVAWWPERGGLDRATVSRLHWMVSSGDGEGWLVYDPEDDDSVSGEELHAAIDGSAFSAGEELRLSSGEIALKVLPGQVLNGNGPEERVR